MKGQFLNRDNRSRVSCYNHHTSCGIIRFLPLLALSNGNVCREQQRGGGVRRTLISKLRENGGLQDYYICWCCAMVVQLHDAMEINGMLIDLIMDFGLPRTKKGQLSKNSPWNFTGFTCNCRTHPMESWVTLDTLVHAYFGWNCQPLRLAQGIWGDYLKLCQGWLEACDRWLLYPTQLAFFFLFAWPQESEDVVPRSNENGVVKAKSSHQSSMTSLANWHVTCNYGVISAISQLKCWQNHLIPISLQLTKRQIQLLLITSFSQSCTQNLLIIIIRKHRISLITDTISR